MPASDKVRTRVSDLSIQLQSETDGMMSFSEAIGSCIENIFNYRGRAPRSEYWYFVLGAMAANLLLGLLSRLIPLFAIFALFIWLGMLAAWCSVLVRRMHDGGWSGWWLAGLPGLEGFLLLLVYVLHGPNFVPKKSIDTPGELIEKMLVLIEFAYWIWIWVLALWPSTKGPNRYGPDPHNPSDGSGDMRAALPAKLT
jgi:uncharacterized membrane protein YhaH (DUF805 family)